LRGTDLIGAEGEFNSRLPGKRFQQRVDPDGFSGDRDGSFKRGIAYLCGGAYMQTGE